MQTACVLLYIGIGCPEELLGGTSKWWLKSISLKVSQIVIFWVRKGAVIFFLQGAANSKRQCGQTKYNIFLELENKFEFLLSLKGDDKVWQKYFKYFAQLFFFSNGSRIRGHSRNMWHFRGGGHMYFCWFILSSNLNTFESKNCSLSQGLGFRRQYFFWFVSQLNAYSLEIW